MFYWVIHQVSIKLKCLLALCYNISIHQINIHLQINQAIQMFKCIFMDALGKIITTQMTINIKEDYIVFFHYRVLFYRICTYKKVISFSTSYGNWSRPWPVQFILTSWHWQPDAISEHMKSEIHCHDEFNIFTIQYTFQYCIEILQQLLSSSSQVKSQSNCPSHTIDWWIQGPRWHLNSFSAHLESTKIPYKPKSTFVYKIMIPIHYTISTTWNSMNQNSF